jgi:acetate kinase
MDCILIINVGSSSLKFAIFQANKKLVKISSGKLDNKLRPIAVFKWIKDNYPNVNIKIIGHRIVHGGKYFLQPSLVTKPVLRRLKNLIPLAPLHMPGEVSFIEHVLHDFPNIPQVACFDTSFHRTQSKLASMFALPRKYTEKEGIIRYGFHGLSYEYIAYKLSKDLKISKLNKVIVAHLGNGSSLCALHSNKSIATSMGFSSLDGLMMGTRCGRMDPGAIIHLMKEKSVSLKMLEKMLYEESGLIGVSGISSDMKELMKSKDPKAKEAIDLFCYYIVHEIGSLIAILEGLNMIVFTGGIGENAAMIRENICSSLNWLCLKIDKNKNRRNSMVISTRKSKIEVYVIPTNEELMIARHALDFIK